MIKTKLPPKKDLGQHFLVDNTVINNIIVSAGDLSNANVLEIGPGDLALTNILITKAKKLVTLEKDDRISTSLTILKSQHSNFDFIMDDALKFNDFASFFNKDETNILISNLPYNVGTQIFINYLINNQKAEIKFHHFILMFQKEVAQRICATPKNKHHGRLSIISNLLADISYLFDVSKDSFSPPPKVMSTVIKVTPLDKPRYPVNINMLEEVTKVAFNGRRKIIRNTLKQYNLNFESIDIDSSKRPEELTIEEFCKISNHIQNKLN